MKFLRKFLNRHESHGNISRNESLDIPSNQQITDKSIHTALRSQDIKQIQQDLPAGSPRFTARENKSENIDFIDDLKNWKEYAEQISRATTIYVCGHMDGLGDSFHHIRYSIALAKQYPQKAVIHLVRDPEFFSDADRMIPPNMRVRKGDKSSEYVSSKGSTDNIAIFNPSLYQRVNRKQFGGEHSECVFAETLKEKEGRDIFSAWNYSVAKTPSNIVNQAFRRMREPSGENLYYTDSAHQIIDQATKLRMLLRVPTHPNFAEIPIREPRPVDIVADVVLILDAKEGQGKKLISAKKWAEYIVSVWSQKPDTSISLVRGVEHPELVEQVVREIPNACKDPRTGKVNYELSKRIIDSISKNIFEGSLQELYDFSMSAKVVVSVDTGPGHALNEGIRKYKGKLPTPKLISLLGSKPFNPMYYRLDCADTLIADGVPDNLDISKVSNLSLHYLQRNQE